MSEALNPSAPRCSRSSEGAGPEATAESGTADRHPRQAILVLGMHRSGTSALSRVLNLLGARLPSNLIPVEPGVGNDAGHWESADFVVIHDGVLESNGSSWY